MRVTVPKSRFSLTRGTKMFLTMNGLVALDLWLVHKYDRTYPVQSLTLNVHNLVLAACLQWGGLAGIMILGLLAAKATQRKLNLMRRKDPDKPHWLEALLYGAATVAIMLLGVEMIAVTISSEAYSALTHFFAWPHIGTEEFRKSGWQALVVDIYGVIACYYIWTALTNREPSHQIRPPVRDRPTADQLTGPIG